jgi:DNA-binding NarL/FixJ family response regulator
MISVAIVDDHPAVRTGLAALVRREPGFVLSLNAPDAEKAAEELDRHPADITVADFQLPTGDGLSLCRELKRRGDCRAAVLYSAFANDWLAIAARVAGLDGVVSKGVPASVLFEALRAVGRGGQCFPDVSVGQLREASELVEPDYQPILGMLLGGTPEREVAGVLGMSQDEVGIRVERILAALKPRATV